MKLRLSLETLALEQCSSTGGDAGIVLQIMGLTALLFLVSGCVRVSQNAGPEEAAQVEIYIVAQGLHAGVAFESSQVEGLRTSCLNAGMRYIEVGFGERRYYMSPDVNPLTGLRALVFRNPGVLHVAGFNISPQHFFRNGGEVHKIKVYRSRFAELIRFIDRSFQRTASGECERLQDGLYGVSAFYAASQRFSLLYNCNDWVLEVLETAGCKVEKWGVATQGGLLRALDGLDQCGG